MHVVDPVRRLRRRGGAHLLGAAAAAAAVMALCAAGAGTGGGAVRAAGGGANGTFAEVFDRSQLVVLAVVEAAPPEDAEVRLAIEASLKGDRGPRLAYAADATSLPLVKGSRIVLLAMDPAALDFRGTVALDVGTDGTIEPDGLSGVPGTVTALLAGYGPPAATAARPDGSTSARPDGSTSARPDGSTAAPASADGKATGSAIPWGALAMLAAAGVATAAIVGAGARRRG